MAGSGSLRALAHLMELRHFLADSFPPTASNWVGVSSLPEYSTLFLCSNGRGCW